MPKEYCLSIRMNPETHLKQLEELAKFEGMSKAEYIRMAIETLYKKHIKKKGQKR
jgi:predicted DNA-binding protein